MRVALLHLDVSGGPEERNLAVLQNAVVQAAEAGAQWVLTPETALQGYFFTQKGRSFQIPIQPSSELEPLRQLAVQYGLTIFLGCAERDAVTGLCYNSCLVIGETGAVIGRQRKVRSHGTGTEAYASPGETIAPIDCGAVQAGILVCADAYFEEYAVELKEKNAQIDHKRRQKPEFRRAVVRAPLVFLVGRKRRGVLQHWEGMRGGVHLMPFLNRHVSVFLPSRARKRAAQNDRVRRASTQSTASSQTG